MSVFRVPGGLSFPNSTFEVYMEGECTPGGKIRGVLVTLLSTTNQSFSACLYFTPSKFRSFSKMISATFKPGKRRKR